MNKIFFVSFFTLFRTIALCQLTPVDQGSTVEFRIKNLGFTVTGTFKGLSGNIAFDPKNLQANNFKVSIDANTVNTNNGLRDEHLRGETYFDVKNYPRISFASTKISPGKNGKFVMFGKLTIKNVSKDISFPFTVTATKDGYVFSGSFTMNRRDFNVGGFSIISDELQVNLTVFAKR